MIMLKHPLKLKSLSGIAFNGGFSDRIRANYEFMTAVISREELFHFLVGKAEQEEPRSGITMIVENISAQNRNEIIIELFNQVLNRILMVGGAGITYQDKVYIDCVLRKLGILDTHTFLQKIQGRKKEYVLKNQLLKIYKQKKGLLKIYRRTESESENFGEQEENYLYEKVIRRLQTAKIYQTVGQWNYMQGAGQKILFHSELALSDQLENVLNMRLSQEKREVLYPYFQMDFLSSNFYETKLPEYMENAKETLSETKEKVFSHLLEAMLFSLTKSVSLAAVFRQFYGRMKYQWYETGFEICNIVKNTVDRCQWQYQNQQVFPTEEIQKFLEQQNRLYQYELSVLQKLSGNTEDIKERLIYKEEKKESKSGLEENNLYQHWAKKISLNNQEITLKLKELLNGKNTETIQNAKKWKEKIENFHTETQETENEKSQDKLYAENKELFFDLYNEIQRIEMAENYLGKYSHISGKKAKELGEELFTVFEELPVQVSKQIEKRFERTMERKTEEKIEQKEQIQREERKLETRKNQRIEKEKIEKDELYKKYIEEKIEREKKQREKAEKEQIQREKDKEELLWKEKIKEQRETLEKEKLQKIQKEQSEKERLKTEKEVIQQIFHEIEAEILNMPQKSAQSLQRNERHFYKTNAAEIVYRQTGQNVQESVDLRESSRGTVKKPVVVSEKLLSQNKINISKSLTEAQSHTNTDTKQINETVQVLQKNIQKHVNQITEQVYQKIEKKLQNERRRRGL